MSETPEMRLRTCRCCGLLQSIPHVPERHRAVCGRCSSTLWLPRRRVRNNAWAGSVGLSALVLYLPAMTLPMVEIERFGHRSHSSIWNGSLSLLGAGEFVVGGIVFLCSVVIPLLKILGLVTITRGRSWMSHRHRALTYRLIEWTGRWGMVDVLLVACLVAFLKLGDIVEVSPGPGVLVFTTMVLLSLVASALFDSHAVWNRDP